MKRGRAWVELGTVGFFQGMALWIAASHWPKEIPGQAPWATLAVGAVVFGLVFELAWTEGNRPRLLVLSLLTSACFALLAYWVWAQVRTHPSSDDLRIPSFLLAGTATLYALGPYIQILQEQGNLRIRYDLLFAHSWNNFFIAALAAFFAGVFWAVIALWAEIFALIKIDLFKRLFYNAPFAWISTATAFAVGVALVRENDRVILALRNIVLSLCRVLLPLLAGITLLFLMSLPFTGLGPLWATRHASALLLSLGGVLLLFVNGVVQDTAEGFPYPVALRRFVEVSLLGLPVIAGLAIHAVALRVNQYGLMPERVWGFFIGGIVFLYAGGYAGALLLRRKRWPLGLQAVNVISSLAIIFIGIAAHTPVLDPLRLSARNQYDRLAEGKVRAAQFDFGALQFELGRVGRAKIEELSRLARHPEIQDIRKQVKLVKALKSRGEWRVLSKTGVHNVLRASDLQVFPTGTRVPQDLLEAISRQLGAYEVTTCASRNCVLASLQFDGDPELEFILARSPYQVQLYDRKPEGWRGLDFAMVKFSNRTQADIVTAIKEGRFGPATPRYPPLRIGETYYAIPE